MTTHTITPDDAHMGTAEAGTWRLGDRVDYTDGIGLDAAFARVRDLLSRRGLYLRDDGSGYVVSDPLALPQQHQQHTPEPWFIRPDGGLGHTSPTRGVTVDLQPMERFRPNLERAVACVNACAGIADPAALTEILSAARGVLMDADASAAPIGPSMQRLADALLSANLTY